ncbi:putative HNHc nuclease [Clostridium swellfunianum]|uniref:putative HNHc nuclease n=1 Tax=Clostridium swellfunianum TaxID=1367462 RepID=UPI00202F9DA0|nr:putative HNHc nuclease [Clostridium swellfunianum]MCM0648658.1 putative HNHc nuclease [Clostridium swellfunianum]
MQTLWQPIQVLGIKEQDNRTILQVAIQAPKEDILRYSSNGILQGELKLDDGKLITAEQRKKIFVTIKDFSLYTGYDAEYARHLLTLAFCYENNIEPFSLSDCSLEIAREFISYLIEFFLDNDIPLSQTAIERTDDIGKYLYLCIKKSICCCCGKQGVVYSLSNDYKISLCNIHHDEAKIKGLQRFEMLYKVYGINIKDKSNP